MTKVGYVFVIHDISKMELVLERKVIEANLSEGMTGREDLALHAMMRSDRTQPLNQPLNLAVQGHPLS